MTETLFAMPASAPANEAVAPVVTQLTSSDAAIPVSVQPVIDAEARPSKVLPAIVTVALTDAGAIVAVKVGWVSA